ncbi:Imm63 family immunity protein [Paenibacillus nuruki]|uniref:Imm63 family immunity protein n=1 Tax=Paenibacillus nuruki TaxID=1886670 RepID=UPI0028063F3D|nr:Imm63 family immunity protein [Paenibacillus nuruki]CAJ1316931.1 Imm63 domain-containing protein [Paenibacillus nuruki]
MIYPANQIIEKITTLLQKTTIYDQQHHMKWVRAPFFDQEPFELSPYVQITDEGYVLQMYERNVQMLNKLTTDVDDVVYWILEDTIQLILHTDRLQRQQDSSYTARDEISIEEQANQAFSEIGGIYEQWHHQHRRSTLETP